MTDPKETAALVRREAAALRYVAGLGPDRPQRAAELRPCCYALPALADELARELLARPGATWAELAAMLTKGKKTAGDLAALTAEGWADVFDVGKRIAPAELLAAYEATLAAGPETRRGLAAIQDAQRTLTEAEQAAKSGKAKTAKDLTRKAGDALLDVEAKTDTAPAFFSVARLEAETRALPDGRPSGWPTLDAADVRFNPGELAICGARTGHGKTAFLVNLLWNWLNAPTKNGDTFLLYEAEEPEPRIFHRLLALAAGLAVNEVRDFLRGGAAAHKNWTRPPAPAIEKGEACLTAFESRLMIVYRPAWTCNDIAAHARLVARSKTVGGVFVDYLQRLPPPVMMDRRDLEISAAGRAFKHLAVILAAPVVCAAQVNRDAIPEKQTAKLNACRNFADAKDIIRAARPDLQNLREGGSEQEADLVLGLLNYAADYRRDKETEPLPSQTPFDVGILKNRYGAVGHWAELAFAGKRGAIVEPALHGGDAAPAKTWGMP